METIVLGDINVHYENKLDKLTRSLMKWCDSFDVQQVQEHNTRNQAILDLILIRGIRNFSPPTVNDELKSDHNAILLVLSKRKGKRVREVRNVCTLLSNADLSCYANYSVNSNNSVQEEAIRLINHAKSIQS